MPEDGTIHILGRIEEVHREMVSSQQTIIAGLDAVLTTVNKSDEIQRHWETRFSEAQQRWNSRHDRMESRIAAIEDLSRSHSSNWATVGAVITPIRSVILAVITAAAIYYLVG